MGKVAMRKSRFSESQILLILKETENGRKVKNLCREYGISTVCFYQWKSKYGGLEASGLKRLKGLEAENNRWKKMYTDMALEHQAVQVSDWAMI
jgi:putative transposase